MDNNTNGVAAPAAGLFGGDGKPLTFQGMPVLFMFIQAPDGSVGFVHGQQPPLQLLHALNAWVESFRFTAYQKAFGLEPKIVPVRGGLVG